MKKGQNNRLHVLIYLLVVLLLSFLILYVSSTNVFSVQPVESTDHVFVEHVSMIIIAPSWNISYMNVTTANITVADFLFECAKVHQISVEKTYWTGYDSFFIEAINDVKNGNGKYWQYYVNGKYADVGCSAYFLHDHDLVEWRFESSPWNFQ